MPRISEDVFTSQQRKMLARLVSGPKESEAQNSTNLLLERKGLIRRIGGPRRSRLTSHDVIEWEITEMGTARLQEQ